MSVLENCAVPEYVFTGLFDASCAVTVNVNAVPDAIFAGPDTEKRVAVDRTSAKGSTAQQRGLR